MEHEQTIDHDHENKPSVKNEVWEWTKALVIAASLVFLIRWLIFSPFVVEGPSMQPNFHTGERLIVNKLIYKIRKPERGEVIVFHATSDKDYIKRVIALPGETIRVEGDNVYVNGELLDEPYLREAIEQAKQRGSTWNGRDYAEHTVPEGTIFAMGDNRSNSLDSRDIGFIEYKQVVGRADLVFWPLSQIHWVH